MDAQLTQAFTLLGIGMITVFVVLMLVVQAGNILIRLVNWLARDVVAVANDDINPSEVAAITAAVEAFTLGKGHVTSIEKKK